MRRRVFVALVVALSVSALAGPAMAGPQGDQFEVVCDQAESLDVVTPGRALWVPGLTAEGSVFVPYRQSWELFFHPAGTDSEDLLADGVSVRNTPPQHLVATKGDRCTFEFVLDASDAETAALLGLPGPGSARLEGTVWGLWVR